MSTDKLNIDLRKQKQAKFDINLNSTNSFNISLREGGSTPGGTTDYNQLINKPRIEGEVLVGDKTFEELHMNALTNMELERLLN